MVQMAFLLPAKLSCNKYLCTKVKNWHGKRQQQCEGDTRPAGPTRAARLQPGLSPAKGHYEHMCGRLSFSLLLSVSLSPRALHSVFVSEIKVSWLWKNGK